MKRAYKVLVLTDHSRHSDQNSIYALLNEMIKHNQCKSIEVVSRGHSINNAFFDKMDLGHMYGTKVNPGFCYSKNGNAYLDDIKKLNHNQYDLVFMRLPRPISDDFLKFIALSFKRALIINHPRGIIKTSNKAHLLNYTAYCPPIKLCKSIEDIVLFANQFPIVLKPLKEYGGKGILKIDGNKIDDGLSVTNTLDHLKDIESYIADEGYLAMKYLKNVDQGDKRILVVDGSILASSVRLPKKGAWLCNVAQGGTSIASDVTNEEKEIVKMISPSLISDGILIYGLDTLVNDKGKRVLSEINTLSIGGFPQAEKQTGKPIIKITINKIFKHANENFK